MTKPGVKIEQQRCAGGLVVRDTQILLIATHQSRHWQLPKGHLEPGETIEQAALRETREETGVTATIVAPLPPVEYDFVRNGAPIHKRVDFFLMRYQSGDTADYDQTEVCGAGWFSWDQGIAQLTFDNERRVARAARALTTER